MTAIGKQFEHLFHGTSAVLKPGDTIEPRDNQGLAWATTNVDVAANYGKNIYKVAPAEDMQRVKAAAKEFGIHASRTGFRVLGEHK